MIFEIKGVVFVRVKFRRIRRKLEIKRGRKFNPFFSFNFVLIRLESSLENTRVLEKEEAQIKGMINN